MENAKPGAGTDYPRTFEQIDESVRTKEGCRGICRLRWPDVVCGCCGVTGAQLPSVLAERACLV
jgi:hypothetical protein